MRVLAVAALAAIAACDAAGVDSPQTGAEMLAEAGLEDIQVG